MTRLTPAELAAVRALLPLATPLEDTEHSTMCNCAECSKVWHHSGNLGHYRGKVVAAVPGLLAHIATLEAEREADRAAAEWVLRFGTHAYRCRLERDERGENGNGDEWCSCGLRALVERLKGE